MVTRNKAPLFFSSSSMAMAIPMPSAGSVPEPSSSMITRLSRPACFKIRSTLEIWAEKVERFSDRFWPSPISQRYSLLMQISASSHATWRPHWAIMAFKATVLMATVFPPVLGPVMMTPRMASPISRDRGTQIVLSMRGCLPSFITSRRPVLILGSVPPYSRLSFPLEKIKSSFSIIFMFCSITWL